MGNDALEFGAVSRAAQSSADLSEKLTPRQLDVLAMLCEGLPNKLIARRLNISAGTVKVHIVHIHRALGVTSRLQAVLAARKLGFDGAARAQDTAAQPTRITPIAPRAKAMPLPGSDSEPLPLLASVMNKRLDLVMA